MRGGASLGPDPVIAVLDAEGRAVEGGDVWFRRLSASVGDRVHAMAVVPLSASRAMALTSYGPPPFRLGINWITP